MGPQSLHSPPMLNSSFLFNGNPGDKPSNNDIHNNTGVRNNIMNNKNHNNSNNNSNNSKRLLEEDRSENVSRVGSEREEDRADRDSLVQLTREERRRRRRATQKYRTAHATRERIRVEAFNVAFTDLRRLLPTLPPDKKLSKIEILRLAICYISYLNNVLDLSS